MTSRKLKSIYSKFQDNKGKWPTEFNGSSFQLQDRKSKDFYTLTPQIIEIAKEDFYNELTTNSNDFEHVIVYDNEGILHAVHVDKLTKFKKLICENSFGPWETPDVKVALDDVLNLYRVHCSAEKVLLPQRGQKKSNERILTPTTKVYDELMMSSSGQIPGMFLISCHSNQRQSHQLCYLNTTC